MTNVPMYKEIDIILGTLMFIIILLFFLRFRYNTIKYRQKHRREVEYQLRVLHLELGDFIRNRHEAGTITYEYPSQNPQYRKFIIKDLMGYETSVTFHIDDLVMVNRNNQKHD